MPKSKSFITLCKKHGVDPEGIPEITSFEDACKVLGLFPKDLPDVYILPKQHQKFIVATYKLAIIAEALNEGWKPDWSNSDQYKYFPWFKVNADKKRPAGFGLSYDDFGYWYANSYAGSRLCFASSELAEYAGKQFKEYVDFMLWT